MKEKGRKRHTLSKVLEMPCHLNNKHTHTQNIYGERNGIISKNEDGI